MSHEQGPNFSVIMVERGQAVFFVSLGCAKNRVDSEHMLGMLRAGGLRPASRLEEAQVAVVNTCGFIEPAVEEAVDAILDVLEFKRRGTLQAVFVTGCLVQRYGSKLRAELPEVDGWLGTGEIPRIVDLVLGADAENAGRLHIGRPTYLADHTVPRVQTTPFFSAYLKIAEGCSHRCSFCMIPRLRGPFRSRPLASLLREAEAMVRRGVREINLIAQDTGSYGEDLQPRTDLGTLLEALSGLRPAPWLRVLYTHPEKLTRRLLDLMDKLEPVCPYLDLPMQHVSRPVLSSMGRHGDWDCLAALMAQIRSSRRSFAVRTTLMVGFPGESERDFEQLLRFVEKMRFDHLGVFVYSAEKGTRAARLPGRVRPETAARRRQEIMQLQAVISEERHRALISKVVPVLVEGPAPETDLLLVGRTQHMAPEVDGRVLINKGVGVAGKIQPVRITEAHAYDLVGEIAG